MSPPDRFSVRSRKTALWLLALAVLMSGALWIHRRIAVEESDLFVPLILGPPPAGLMVVGQVPNGIEVRVRGPRHLLKTLPQANPVCRIDLAGIQRGTVPVHVEAAGIQLPQGVAILTIEPAMMTLRIDSKIQKQVPVVIRHAGQPAAGHQVGTLAAVPTSILLAGPEYLLGPLDRVSTQPVDISGKNESFQKAVALDLPEGIDIAARDKVVKGSIGIDETVSTREFKAIAVSGKNSAYDVRVTPANIDISVKGPVNLLDRLGEKNGLNVYVDLNGLKPGVYARRAVIGLPVKTTLIDAKPEIFTITLTKP
jgi:YbbR domain-containing protein